MAVLVLSLASASSDDLIRSANRSATLSRQSRSQALVLVGNERVM